LDSREWGLQTEKYLRSLRAVTSDSEKRGEIDQCLQ
jgi:hypothetical protein